MGEQSKEVVEIVLCDIGELTSRGEDPGGGVLINTITISVPKSTVLMGANTDLVVKTTLETVIKSSGEEHAPVLTASESHHRLTILAMFDEGDAEFERRTLFVVQRNPQTARSRGQGLVGRVSFGGLVLEVYDSEIETLDLTDPAENG